MRLPDIPDTIVNDAVLARGHGHTADGRGRIGVGIAMRRALEAVFSDLVELYERTSMTDNENAVADPGTLAFAFDVEAEVDRVIEAAANRDHDVAVIDQQVQEFIDGNAERIAELHAEISRLTGRSNWARVVGDARKREVQGRWSETVGPAVNLMDREPF